jgi:hypothetical protein
MAGYVIEDRLVPLLEAEWLAILSSHSMDELHMREFVPPHGKHAHWSETEKRALLEPLIALIHQHCVVGVGAALQIDDFTRGIHARSHQKAPELVESPYGWCLRYCSVQAAAFADSHGLIGAINYTLDQGCSNRHHAEERFREAKKDNEIRDRFRLGDISFADSKTVPALQCADLLAYEMYKEVDRRLSEAPRKTRKSFMALLRENDRLVTIDPTRVKQELYRGFGAINAIISLLPQKEKFQVWCYGLRSLSEEQRLAIFEVVPAYEKIYALCLASGEMGLKLSDLPPETLPPDDPATLLPIVNSIVENMTKTSPYETPPESETEKK